MYLILILTFLTIMVSIIIIKCSHEFRLEI